MRILFIHNKYQFRGGEDVAVEQEVAILKEKGHTIEILIFENKIAPGIVNKLKAGVQAIYNTYAAKTVKKYILDFKPDVIHVHNLFFMASPAVLFAAHKLHIPVIATLHNYRLICANALLLRNNEVCELCVDQKIPLAGIKYRCYRNSAVESALATTVTSVHKLWHTWQKKVTSYIVLNEFSKSRLLNSSLNLPEQKLLVKPNFIPDPQGGQWPREDYFLFVGRLSKEKGGHIMLEAFASMPQYNLIVIGEGPEKETLQSKYQQFTNIIFNGGMQPQEVLAFLKRSKALVFPSIWYEGLPFTILEAFATGTPVIASKLGSMASMVADGYNGFHFRKASVEDLQEKVTRFSQLTDAAQQSLSENARRSYLDNYHPEVHYTSILRIYKNAISQTSQLNA